METRLCPIKYIEKMVANYERIFGQKPRNAVAREGDHPELDCSELLNHEDTKIYQSLIGALQWVVQLGRIDITAVMTMSRFRAAPGQGHMWIVHGFINKMKHASEYVLKNPTTQTSQKSSTTGRTHVTGSQGRVPDDAPHLLANE
jgi:hypothetical protein